jgi:hypothetical protein
MGFAPAAFFDQARKNFETAELPGTKPLLIQRHRRKGTRPKQSFYGTAYASKNQQR